MLFCFIIYFFRVILLQSEPIDCLLIAHLDTFASFIESMSLISVPYMVVDKANLCHGKNYLQYIHVLYMILEYQYHQIQTQMHDFFLFLYVYIVVSEKKKASYVAIKINILTILSLTITKVLLCIFYNVLWKQSAYQIKLIFSWTFPLFST